MMQIVIPDLPYLGTNFTWQLGPGEPNHKSRAAYRIALLKNGHEVQALHIYKLSDDTIVRAAGVVVELYGRNQRKEWVLDGPVELVRGTVCKR